MMKEKQAQIDAQTDNQDYPKPKRRVIGTMTAKVHSKTDLRELENKKTVDMVNSPSHYNEFGIECIDAIQASMSAVQFKGHLKACCIKYLWRYEDKNGVEDLRKARWYLQKLIEKNR